MTEFIAGMIVTLVVGAVSIVTKHHGHRAIDVKVEQENEEVKNDE